MEDAKSFILLVSNVSVLAASSFHAFLLRDSTNGCAARFTVYVYRS